MLYLLKYSMYDDLELDPVWEGHTKYFQHIEFDRIAAKYDDLSHDVGEIGSQHYFKNLFQFEKARKFIVDPYNGAPGGGLVDIPKLPYPIGLFRCLVGDSERQIPNDFFSITFSMSVIEHIGQAEVGYDRTPTGNPPEAQEAPRRVFCEDLFRMTRPGGFTIHTVDHAARNMSFTDNFLDAGFELMDNVERPTLEECMSDRDNVIQKLKWGQDVPSDLSDWELDAVAMMGFRKPL